MRCQIRAGSLNFYEDELAGPRSQAVIHPPARDGELGFDLFQIAPIPPQCLEDWQDGRLSSPRFSTLIEVFTRGESRDEVGKV